MRGASPRHSREGGNPDARRSRAPAQAAHSHAVKRGVESANGECRGAKPRCRGRGGVPHSVPGGWVGRTAPARHMRQHIRRCETTRREGCERGDTTPQVARHRFRARRRPLHGEILGSAGDECQCRPAPATCRVWPTFQGVGRPSQAPAWECRGAKPICHGRRLRSEGCPPQRTGRVGGKNYTGQARWRRVPWQERGLAPRRDTQPRSVAH